MSSNDNNLSPFICIYTYIYIYIEREVIVVGTHMFRASIIVMLPQGVMLHMLAQDTGGPSKGGFLNNRLCSYRNTIYTYIYIYIMCVMNVMACVYN